MPIYFSLVFDILLFFLTGNIFTVILHDTIWHCQNFITIDKWRLILEIVFRALLPLNHKSEGSSVQHTVQCFNPLLNSSIGNQWQIHCISPEKPYLYMWNGMPLWECRTHTHTLPCDQTHSSIYNRPGHMGPPLPHARALGFWRCAMPVSDQHWRVSKA